MNSEKKSGRHVMTEKYFTVESIDGKGLYFITECGNEMYHIGNNPLRYNGVLCPKCFWKNKKVTLKYSEPQESEDKNEQIL